MRVSRAPEHRGGAGSPIVLILVLLIVLIVGGVVIFLLLGRNPLAAPPVANPPVNAQPIQPAANPQANNPAPPVSFERPTLAPVSPQEISREPAAAGNTPFQPPRVDFGEVVAEGFVDLQLLGGTVRTWYTLHLDSSTKQTTYVFALYDGVSGEMSRTAIVQDYSLVETIKNAQVTIFYPDYPERVITFDKETGTIISQQFYTDQPNEPSMFSREMRIDLIHHNLALNNEDGSIRADLQVDLTGIVSDREGISVLQNDPVAVENALNEVQLIIDQIESRRPKS